MSGEYVLMCESCRRGGHHCDNYVFAAEVGGRCRCPQCDAPIAAVPDDRTPKGQS